MPPPSRPLPAPAAPAGPGGAPGPGGPRPDAPLARPAHLRALFSAFTLLSLQGFGGVLGVVHRELVERRRWIDPREFAGDWALAQVLPGPNVCNLALMYGWRQFGWRGALVALAGLLCLPTLLLVLVAGALASAPPHPALQGALSGMAAVGAGIVAGAGLKLARGLADHPLGRRGAVLAAALALAALLLGHWPLWAVVAAVGLPCCLLTGLRLPAAAAGADRPGAATPPVHPASAGPAQPASPCGHAGPARHPGAPQPRHAPPDAS